VHGLSIPLGKLGFYLPRTLSRAIESPGGDGEHMPPFSLGSRVSTIIHRRVTSRRNSEDGSTPNTGQSTASRAVYRIGGTVIPKRSGSPAFTTRQRIARNGETNDTDPESRPGTPGAAPAGPAGRTIRFPDEDLTTPQTEARDLNNVKLASE
jgi:hypothetical protein